jgi:hypothetical protein
MKRPRPKFKSGQLVQLLRDDDYVGSYVHIDRPEWYQGKWVYSIEPEAGLWPQSVFKGLTKREKG